MEFNLLITLVSDSYEYITDLTNAPEFVVLCGAFFTAKRWRNSVWDKPFDIMSNEYRLPVTPELAFAVNQIWNVADSFGFDRLLQRLAKTDSHLKAFLDFVSEHDMTITPFLDETENEVVLEIG